MNNKRFDLNLVRVFCTLYDTGSLTLTAELLEITQPAVSHSLKKMRDYYDDPLFVRADGKMVPTQLAMRIAPDLKKSIELINLSLEHTFFSKGTSAKNKFTLSMSDMSQTFYIPSICLAMESLLNHVRLNIIQVQQENIEPIMRKGELDFALGNLPLLNTLEDKIIHDRLFEDQFVCMVREAHPLISSDGGVQFRKLKLLSVNNNITGHNDLLEEINSTFIDNITLTIPNYTIAPEIISKTDFGVIIPKSIAKRYNINNEFRFYDINLKNNVIEIGLYYHKLYKNDPSIKWMRGIFIEHFQTPLYYK